MEKHKNKGKFSTTLDLRATNPGEWQLLSPLVYTSSAGDIYIVPTGMITDLASIPKLLRPAIDRNGLSRPAAVLHDYLYLIGSLSRKQADQLFLEALLSCGVGDFVAKGMYLAVRAFGGGRYAEYSGR